MIINKLNYILFLDFGRCFLALSFISNEKHVMATSNSNLS